MDVTPSVATIIVHYNKPLDTSACVQSVLKLNYPNNRIYVLDNCSPDGSGVSLQEQYASVDSVEVILLNSNGGFAAGCNHGAHRAREDGASLLWFLNPDTSVDAEALSPLVETFVAQENTGAVGSKILFADPLPSHTQTLWSLGGTVDPVTCTVAMRGYGEADTGQYGASIDCDYLPGASLLTSVAVFNEVGDLPEEFFMYFEETDWCMRVRQSGRRLLIEPRSIVYHDYSEEKIAQPHRIYYYNRSELAFWRRWAVRRAWYRRFLILIFRDVPRTLWAYWRCPEDLEQKQLFRYHLKSYRDFLLGYTGQVV